MRKIAFYIINLFVIGSLWSCQGDEPTTTSIFDEEEEVAEEAPTEAPVAEESAEAEAPATEAPAEA